MKTTLLPLLLTIALLTACGASTTPSPTAPPLPLSTSNLYDTPAAVVSSPVVPTETSAAALSGNVAVSIAGFAFNPADLIIKVGTTVTWTNNDSATHDVKALDNSWGSDNLGKGDTFSFTFNQARTYAYRCSFHAGMKGTITVVP